MASPSNCPYHSELNHRPKILLKFKTIEYIQSCLGHFTEGCQWLTIWEQNLSKVLIAIKTKI